MLIVLISTVKLLSFTKISLLIGEILAR